MTDQNSQTPAQPATTDPHAPVVTPQAVYIKDFSFEALHARAAQQAAAAQAAPASVN